MTKTRLGDTRSPLYAPFTDLYARSFPIFEQRTAAQQVAAFASPHYHLDLYHRGDTFVGFIASWQFDRCSYVEHFAVHLAHRGRGYGTELLNGFVAQQVHPIILEIDPIVDEVSATRWRFYERCGFCQNNYVHTHPPYRVGYAGHPLVVLSSGGSLTPELYGFFLHDLTNVVMSF